MPVFDRSEPVTLSLRMHRGTATVRAEETATVRVDITGEDGTDAGDKFTVELDGDVLVVHAPDRSGPGWRRGPRATVVVRVPADSTVAAKSSSADLNLLGRYKTVRVDASSASISLDTATGDAHLKTSSGTIEAARVGGSLSAGTSSGELRLGDVTGDVIASTASGDITLTSAAASVRAGTASGNLEIGALSRGRAHLKSSSGDITVGVLPGTAVYLDLNTASGRTTSDLAMTDAPPQDTAVLELAVKTASGNITVHRAAASPLPADASGPLPAAARPVVR